MEWLRQAIDNSGLRQVDIANASGISEQHLSNILNGRGKHSAKIEAKLRQILGVFDPKLRKDAPPPITLTKVIHPRLERIPVHRIGLNESFIREPAPGTHEEIHEQTRQMKKLMEDFGRKRPIPPIVVLQHGDYSYLLLWGRATLTAAENARVAELSAWVYRVPKTDLEIFRTALNGD